MTSSSLSVAILHQPFYQHRWTIYPQEASLLSHVEIEEKSMLKREEIIARGGQDSGRLTYNEAYAIMPKSSLFDVFFREDIVDSVIGRMPDHGLPQMFRTFRGDTNRNLPPFPPVPLAASVNIVVRMRTMSMASHISLSDEGQVISAYCPYVIG
jgi:hypothetical protein